MKSGDPKPGDKFLHYSEHHTNEFSMLVYLKTKYPYRISPPYISQNNFDTAQFENKIYYAGGGKAANKSEPEKFFSTVMCITINFPDICESTVLPNMNHGRADHSLVIVNGTTLFVVGGRNSDKEMNSCERLVLGKDKWEDCASLNERKLWVTVCPIQNRYLYAFGGAYNGNSSESDMIEFLDTNNTSAKSWTKITLVAGQDIWNKAVFVGACELSEGNILLFGGALKGDQFTATYSFDIKTLKITKRKPLVEKDAFYRTKPAIIENKLLIVGTTGGDMHIYDTKTEEWSLIKKAIWNSEGFPSIKSDTY